MSVAGFDIQYLINGVEDQSVLQRMTVAFERASSELEDFGRHVFPKMVPVFEAEVGKQFDAQGGGPNRGSWAALSPAYEAWKSVAYPGAPILVRTGALRAALTTDGDSHALRDFSGDEFNFGTSGIPYASFHQSGTAHMPDRPPFDFGTGFEEEIRRVALEGAREAIHAAGADEFTEDQISSDVESF